MVVSLHFHFLGLFFKKDSFFYNNVKYFHGSKVKSKTQHYIEISLSFFWVF